MNVVMGDAKGIGDAMLDSTEVGCVAPNAWY